MLEELPANTEPPPNPLLGKAGESRISRLQMNFVLRKGTQDSPPFQGGRRGAVQNFCIRIFFE